MLAVPRPSPGGLQHVKQAQQMDALWIGTTYRSLLRPAVIHHEYGWPSHTYIDNENHKLGCGPQ